VCDNKDIDGSGGRITGGESGSMDGGREEIHNFRDEGV